MAVKFIGKHNTPSYLALSSDVNLDGTISGANIFGCTILLTDTSEWKIITGDLTIEDWVFPVDNGNGVQSVTGDGVDNTDPLNPVLSFPTPADISAATSTQGSLADSAIQRSGSTTDAHLAVWNGSNANSIKDGGTVPSTPTAIRSYWEVLATPSSPSASDDEFTSGSLSDSWIEYDPNSILTVSVSSNNYLQFTESTRSGDNITGIGKTLPAGDFSIITKVSLTGKTVNYQDAGLVLFEDVADSTKKLCSWGVRYDGAVNQIVNFKWTNSTTVASAPLAPIIYNQTAMFLRIRRTSTTYTFDWSSDGLAWRNAGSDAALGFTPAQMGLFINNSNVGFDIQAKFPFFRYVASDLGINGILSGRVATIYA